jgi:hypothetical protein
MEVTCPAAQKVPTLKKIDDTKNKIASNEV